MKIKDRQTYVFENSGTCPIQRPRQRLPPLFKKGRTCGGYNVRRGRVVPFRDPVNWLWLTLLKTIFLLFIFLLEISTLLQNAFRNFPWFGFYGTLKMAENGRRVVDNEGGGRWHFLWPVFSVLIYPICTKLSINISCMNIPTAFFLLFEFRLCSHFTTFLSFFFFFT